MHKKLTVQNIFGEALDLLVEGNASSKDVVIFVHGYGTDKDEGFSSFFDLASYLQNDYLLLRFDLSGYGKSEGRDSDFQFQKAAGDVDSVIRYAKRKYPQKNINILAHSLGTFVVSLLSPFGIKKIIFTSIVNSNTKFVSKQLEKRIKQRGGIINKDGISVYPRSKGGIQRIGKDFWRTLEQFDPLEYISELGDKTNLIIFKPKQDEVLSDRFFDAYKNIKNVTYVEVDGDHNFKDPSQRAELFKRIEDFLANGPDATN